MNKQYKQDTQNEITFKGLTPDRFQLRAFRAIDKGISVLTSAPTGAGKTLIIEYAIEKVLAQNKQLIYTSPIKALSNQKYRDFCKDYGDENVGIITGDIKINPYAPILIMTTEILRNMLHSQVHEVFDNLLYVTFDEIHYLTDPMRGVVWEETLILLPKFVRILLLSATISNAEEIAEWLRVIRKISIEVIESSYRPVPLQDHLFYYPNSLVQISARTKAGKLRRFREKAIIEKIDMEIEDDSGIILRKRSNYYELRRRTDPKVLNSTKYIANRQRPSELLAALLSNIPQHRFLPMLYFLFSRKKCEKTALAITRMFNFLSVKERKTVDEYIKSTEAEIVNTDESLEQIDNIFHCLRVGVVYHHSGLLPPLKELIEVLFSKGLIKILIATETFALGVNMPAKTVVFNGMRKYDGISNRLMTPGELAQMSGRAGRRGIDKIGNTIINLSDTTDSQILRLLKTEPDRLKSQFRLSYNMIINLLSMTSDDDVFDFFRKSLFSFQNPKFKDIRKFKQQFYQIRKLLSAADYFDPKSREITQKGKLLRNIVHENVILVTEFVMKLPKLNLSPKEMAAAFSILAFSEPKRYDRDTFPQCNNKKVKEAYRIIHGLNDNLIKIEKTLHIEKTFTSRSFGNQITGIVSDWANDVSLYEICQKTTLLEGDVINLLRRVVNLMRQVSQALKASSYRQYDKTDSVNPLDTLDLRPAIRIIHKAYVLSTLEAEFGSQLDLDDNEQDYFT